MSFSLVDFKNFLLILGVQEPDDGSLGVGFFAFSLLKFSEHLGYVSLQVS